MLEDLVRPGLSAVICGTAAGKESAARGEYYAGRGNRFWRVLHETGLTDRQLLPSEWRRLPEYGLGLTDLAKSASGMDAELPPGCFDRERLREAVYEHRPKALAFNGKRAAEAFLGHPVRYGPQDELIGLSWIWVLPSTSGAANGSWDPKVWREFADWTRHYEPEPLPFSP